jgi:hypothetical protein
VEDPIKSSQEQFSTPAYNARPERSFGLKAFDVFLYPFVTNTGVFVTSVFFTYLTNRGSHFGTAGSKVRQFGELVEKRGTWLRGKLMDMGMPEPVANNVKMVFWSFADGTLLAPVIKNFEDNRENIAQKIDQLAGTEPDDPAVYTAEPKQSWKSVLGARMLTAGIVAPTAGALNNVRFRMLGEYNDLNYHLFTRPGIALGNELKENAALVRRFGKENIEEVANCTFFEAFYTSVCTAGQYYFSRWIASDKKPAAMDTDHGTQPHQQIHTPEHEGTLPSRETARAV